MLFKDFDSVRFVEQRKKLFSLIDAEIERDGHHKSYEGKMEICFNNRFANDEDEPEISIELSCYVAPISGRGENFQSQDELDELLNRWEQDLKSQSDLYPSYNYGTNCFGCPYCSCGCRADWQKTHILRCTGCHRGFNKYEGMLNGK
jgi:hypothetical protein